MKLVTNLFNSSLGRKYIMAATGAGMFFFVIGHLVGNLQVFLGAETLNHYGHFLQTNKEIVWPARIGLLVMIALHVWSAIKLSAENRAARPVPYANWNPTVASYASRTMLMSGLIVFAFIVYHLLHYTVCMESINLVGQNFEGPAFETTLKNGEACHDIYKMLIVGFSHPAVAIFYVISMGLLSLHLSHGLSAMFQSLGWKKKSYAGTIDGFAKGMAVFIFLGYSSIPLAVLLKLVK